MCTKKENSYFCSCVDGYRLDSDQHSCLNIDECLEGTHGCRWGCEDTDGGFQCRCPEGFRLGEDFASCTDVNECETGEHQCSAGCINLNGTYGCHCDGETVRLGGDCDGKFVTLCFVFGWLRTTVPEAEINEHTISDGSEDITTTLAAVLLGVLFGVVVLVVIYCVVKAIRKR